MAYRVNAGMQGETTVVDLSCAAGLKKEMRKRDFNFTNHADYFTKPRMHY